jgi:hypothetical protein
MLALGVRPYPRRDPAKEHVQQRIEVIEQRLSLVEEWQRAEAAVRGSGRAATNGST